ncbi:MULTISPECIES: hypothetical protein [unclassified Lysobacter]|uniref:hypothetical protein n=1 Tax=unclassified Lysobacter TaxID=2635362 RepID=UPI0006FA210D|nr:MULTISPECIES: hypothetical protein [unclassified Lysobacter]KQZ66551.1 hypothetical protein ASD53_15730 [Lysobacter sp. Root559]KRA72071.1 hypothetical protein ASD78_17090 [Lysobacter sp. Root667]KRC32703.1 hypothetical protein ASE10_14095 [Lysobacter sp. Root76]KRD67953.1 hypothetical protein ASE45_14665 [Lysobacter sp. Root96]
MNVPARPVYYSLFTALAASMVATRFHHFGDALHLPDASMAVFFLGGLWLRRHLGFAAFLVLAVAIDWIAIQAQGKSFFEHYCVTPAYACLLLAYAALWYGGRWYAERLRATPRALSGAFGVGLAAASLSFLISNGAFYWLGGRYEDPNVGQYLSRLWQWGPLFVRTTLSYIAVGLVAYALIARAAGARTSPRVAEV